MLARQSAASDAALAGVDAIFLDREATQRGSRRRGGSFGVEVRLRAVRAMCGRRFEEAVHIVVVLKCA